ncbi:MAG: TRAP transporter substrate-binding protein [Candidatus Caldatribacteriota bacterium]
MKRFILILFTFLIIVSVVLVGNGKELILRYSGGFPPNHPVSEAQVWFSEELEKRSEGEIKVDTFFGGELYTYAAAIDAASSGALDLGYTSISHIANKNPLFDFSSYFFMIKNHQQMAEISEEVKKIMGPALEEQGLKLVHIFYFGECGIISKVPIRESEDMKGLIIRSTSPAMTWSLEALGATPATIASAEQYDAMQKGTIDGGGTGYATMVSRKLYEVTDYVIGPFWNPLWISFMSLDVWNSLSEEVQKLIQEVSLDTEKKSFELVSGADQEAIDFLKANQKEFIYLTAEEQKKWAEPIKPLFQKWAETCQEAGYGEEAQKLLELIE